MAVKNITDLHVLGDVGIGTTSPGARLDVVGNGNAVQIRRSNGFASIKASSDNSGHLILDSYNSSGAVFLQNYAGGNVYMGTGGGKVGIGNTSPSEKLHVSGRVHIGDVNYSYGASNYHILLAENSNDAYISNIEGYGILSAGGYYHGGNLRMLNSTSTAYSAIQMRPDGTMHFESATGGTAGTTIGASTKMYISGAGNVGIGTTSPSEKLHVTGNGLFTGGIYVNNTAAYIWNATNGVIRFGTNNIERARITSDGDVGIGTTSPENKLHVQQADVFTGIHTTAGIRIKSSGASAIDSYHGTIALSRGTGGVAISAVQEASDSDVMGIAFFTHPSATGGDAAVEKMRLDQDGNLGIGTTSPGGKLHIQTDADSEFIFTGASTSGYATTFHMDNTGLDIGHNSTGRALNLKTGSLDRLTILGSGNVGIDTTNPSEKLEVNGNILASGDITAFSDARIKENVETLPNAIESVKQMRGVTYNKIGEEKQSIGVIAQEVQAVLPQLVSEHNDGMLSVAYGNITGVLIEAIKEQQKQIEELKAKLNGLTK